MKLRLVTRIRMTWPLLLSLMASLPVTPTSAVDLEAFEFNEANGTELFQTLNSANAGNSWFTTNFGVDVLPSTLR